MQPAFNNFYAAFSYVSKNELKEFLISNGWECRNASWTDYELKNDWSEFLLQGEEQAPLLSGSVTFDTSRTELLNNLFTALGARFQYEFYDASKKLIFERKSER